MEARALVGRERELQALETALASVARGQRALLMLSGEAGIGKTRLLEELATRVVAQGGIATWGRMWEVGLTPAFWPFIQVLGALHAPLQATPSLDTLEERADASTRLSRFGEVARFLGRRADERPLAILLDDLHMADPSSLQLLEYLLPVMLNKPVLFALAARDGDARAEVAAALSRIQRGALRLDLRPLEASAVETLVAGRADFRRVFELSEGNPLFVEELLASGSLQLPKLSSVRTVIRERVAALPADSVTALVAASVVGREFSAQVVAHMIGRAEVGAQLQPVRASGMLSMTVPDRYRFSHALVAEAIADELDPSERARLHLRAARALERHDASDTSAIAHHLLAAGHLAAEAAITASERAARTCLLQLAFEDAASLLAGALHALTLAAPGDQRRRSELLCLRAQALQHAGRHKEAAALCDEAAQLARTLLHGPDSNALLTAADHAPRASTANAQTADDWAHTLQPLAAAQSDPHVPFARDSSAEHRLDEGVEARAEAAELLARIALVRGLEFRFGRTDPLLVSLLREALDALSAAPQGALRARLLARLAAAEQPARDPRQPVARALEAIALAAKLEPADRMDVMYVASAALIDYVEPAVLERIQEQVLSLARGRDRSIAVHARLRLCFCALDRMDRSAYHAAVAEFTAEANALGLARWTRHVHMLQALTALFEGRFRDAQLAAAELERSLGAPTEDGTRFSLDVHRVMYAWVTTTPVDHAILARIADYAPGRLAIAAWIAVQEGEPERARSALAELGGRIPVDPDMGAMVAAAVAYVDDAALAEQALATLGERSGRIVLTSMVGFAVMDLYDRLLMLLARAAKRWELIDGYAERALDVARQLGSPVWAARVRADWADALEARASAADSSNVRVPDADSGTSPAANSSTANAKRPTRSDATNAESGNATAAHSSSASAKRPPRSAATDAESGNATAAHSDDSGVRGDVERARELRALALAEAQRLGMPGLIQRCRVQSESTRETTGLQLERAGELWTVRGFGEEIHVKSSRGMELLAHLIAEPGREWHVLDLVGASAADGGDSGPHLDAQAREAYRLRARELSAQRDEAEASADLGRIERVQRELDALSAELERAFGLGGRERRVGAASERARSNVQRRISHAIAQIREASPALGQHLARAIRTGTYCAYETQHS